MKRKTNIGLFGFGVVGYGLYQIITNNNDSLFEIKKICVKQRNKLRSISTDKFVYEQSEILEDDSIDIIVELINDSDAAYDIVISALRKGKPVVSANKKMLATHLKELARVQKEYQTFLFYEGAVCGSIPIISLLNNYYWNDQIDNLATICNGTTNYILSKIEEGVTFPIALMEAQDKGFAEVDSSSDIMGYDSRYKLSLLIANSYGLHVDFNDIFCFGIQNIKNEDFEFASKLGYNIKLIGYTSIDRVTNEICAYVVPKLVLKEDELSRVHNVENPRKQGHLFRAKQGR